jgi:cyclophilin family peptidyl-prolyl cis-trans isomerase
MTNIINSIINLFTGKQLQSNLKIYNFSKEEMNSLNFAKIETSKGIIILKLFNTEVPNTVANFSSLVKSGFYKGLKFHRVIERFMAQGGCPQGTGRGGPGWKIPCETALNTHKHKKGVISMAHAGPNTGGSQFFICFATCQHLDGVHTVFGEIEAGDIESFKVLDSIRQNDIINNIEILASK